MSDSDSDNDFDRMDVEVAPQNNDDRDMVNDNQDMDDTGMANDDQEMDNADLENNVGNDEGQVIGFGHGQRQGRGRRNFAPPNPDPGWQKSQDINPPAIHNFTEVSGPTDVFVDGTSPMDMFNKIFGDDFFL